MEQNVHLQGIQVTVVIHRCEGMGEALHVAGHFAEVPPCLSRCHFLGGCRARSANVSVQRACSYVYLWYRLRMVDQGQHNSIQNASQNSCHWSM